MKCLIRYPLVTFTFIVRIDLVSVHFFPELSKLLVSVILRPPTQRLLAIRKKMTRRDFAESLLADPLDLPIKSAQLIPAPNFGII